MSQFQNVPGPSQDEFDQLSDHIAQVDDYELLVNGGTLKVWRRGKTYVATFEGATKNDGVLTTLSSAHRPPQTARGVGLNAECTVYARLTVGTNGEIQVANASNASISIYGSVTWVV